MVVLIFLELSKRTEDDTGMACASGETWDLLSSI
jgi:hypothetical protein